MSNGHSSEQQIFEKRLKVSSKPKKKGISKMEETTNTALNTRYVELSCDQIEIDENICIRAKDKTYQSSNEFRELRESTIRNGIMNPVQVSHDPQTGKYKLIEGVFRLKSAEGRNSKIPAVISDQSPALAYYSLNMIRQNFTVIEKAEAIKNACEELKQNNLNYRDIARKLCISPQSISEHLKIANIPEELKSKARHMKKCTIHKLREIAGIEDVTEQEQALNDYLTELYGEYAESFNGENQKTKTSEVFKELSDETYEKILPKNQKDSNTSDIAKNNKSKNQKKNGVSPKRPKADYVRIEQNKIEKFKQAFGKKIEKWEIDEKKHIINEIDGLIDYLQRKKHEVSGEIQISESMKKEVNHIIQNGILTDDSKQLSRGKQFNQGGEASKQNENLSDKKPIPAPDFLNIPA